ncbi:MAG: hypothetical protein KME26_00555 [Oscillatoria princeps RMCB-10]|nr:hypothetical protein [Oscillatoria princeps RMCB-10]
MLRLCTVLSPLTAASDAADRVPVWQWPSGKVVETRHVASLLCSGLTFFQGISLGPEGATKLYDETL